MIRVLTKKTSYQLYKALAIDFREDELYLVAFPNQETRDAIMKQYFKIYMKAIIPYCLIMSAGEADDSVMVVYDSRLWKRMKYTWSMVVLNIRLVTLLPKIKSWKDAFHALHCYGMFTSSWVKDFEIGEYFHLDLLCTKKESRNQGYGGQLVSDILRQADEAGMDITLETHELQNVAYYEHFGFTLVKTISQDGYGISQYCMLRRCQEVTDEDK